ncbi:MAG: hypothetical protein ACKVJK_20745 [Methylophagaceae bacterium]
MAKRSRKRVVTDPNELRLTELDMQYYGPEPKFAEGEVTEDNRKSKQGNALNWYSKIIDGKMAKKFIVEWLHKNDRVDDAIMVSKCPDARLTQTVGSLCRMSSHRGWVLTEREIEFVNTRAVQPAQAWTDEQGVPSEEEEEEKPKRKSIQDIMMDKLHEVGGEIDGMIDQILDNRLDFDAKFKESILKLLHEYNPLAQHIPILVQSYEKEKNELLEVLLGKDEQLVEAYSNLSKSKLKNMIKMYEQIISVLNSYATLKIQSRAKRKTKPVSIDKIVSKLKYLRKFECSTTQLKLESISPTSLQHAKEAWCYDTVKRKLHHYIADELGGEMFIKGNTLYGFDKAKSEIKTLRKPKEQIKEIMGSKPIARKFFDSIKAVGVQPKGRFNDQIVILKAF